MRNVTRHDPRAQAKRPAFRDTTESAPGRESRTRDKHEHGEESYRGHDRLTNRVALVTGADSGIGRAVAVAFAREGADVAISYLNEHEEAKVTERLVTAAGRRALLIPGDLSERSTCDRIVDATVGAFGRIDILVNNAAYRGRAVAKFEEIDDDRIAQAFRVNVIAMFHLVRRALPHMREGSSIINVASIQAYHPSAAILDYAATKGAIVTLTKGFAEEVIKRGIRANAIAPGPVWTPLVVEPFPRGEGRPFAERSPREHPASPADIAAAFVFLACDESRYVNGEVLGLISGTSAA